MNFGSLTLNSAGAVAIAKDSSTQLSGVSAADSLTLSSTAGITNAANASLAVANNASFSGTSITLGNQAGDTMNFGSLTFNSVGAVNIAEDSSTAQRREHGRQPRAFLHRGDHQRRIPSLAVANNASFSGTSITLGNQAGDTMNFGSLTFNSVGR